MTQAVTGAATPSPSHAVLAQAADWYARLRDGRAGAEEYEAWQAWLLANAEHQAAWRYVEDISVGFAPLCEIPASRHAAEALCAAARRLQSRRRLLTGVGVTAGGAMLGWMGWRQGMLPGTLMALGADYRTRIGEQRELILADGTRLWLNTHSAVNVRFDAHDRVVELVQGEVFVATAKDPSRRFFVKTRHGTAQALGTRFNVYQEGTHTSLAVFEGAVEICTGGGSKGIVRAGRQTRFDATDIALLQPADQSREGWTQGALVADNIALADLIQELRRYRAGHLGVADNVGSLKVYGNFPIHDTDRVLRMLAVALPIKVVQPFPWWTSIEAAH